MRTFTLTYVKSVVVMDEVKDDVLWMVDLV